MSTYIINMYVCICICMYYPKNGLANQNGCKRIIHSPLIWALHFSALTLRVDWLAPLTLALHLQIHTNV